MPDRNGRMLGIGAVSGVVDGLLGGGNGVLTVPALDHWTSLPRRRVAAGRRETVLLVRRPGPDDGWDGECGGVHHR